MDNIQTSAAPPAADQTNNSTTGPAESGQAPAAPVFSVAAAPAEAPAPAAPKPAEAAKEPAPPAAGQEGASLSEANKLRVCCKALKNMERDIANIIRLLESNALIPSAEVSALADSPARPVTKDEEVSSALRSIEGRVTEGVFDGQNMVGSDGKIYTVPANYASKSKLVEGDLLKLTITPKGSFIYKQIGPIERSRVIASLGFDVTIGEFYATTENRRWSVLKASVTYFKGEPGDEVVLLVPKNAPSKWAAVENIIKRNPLA